MISTHPVLAPRVSLAVAAGAAGVFRAVEATIDTGFTAWLTLPPDIIRELSLLYQGTRPVALASGGTLETDLMTRNETEQEYAQSDRKFLIGSDREFEAGERQQTSEKLYGAANEALTPSGVIMREGGFASRPLVMLDSGFRRNDDGLGPG